MSYGVSIPSRSDVCKHAREGHWAVRLRKTRSVLLLSPKTITGYGLGKNRLYDRNVYRVDPVWPIYRRFYERAPTVVLTADGKVRRANRTGSGGGDYSKLTEWGRGI